jgi:excisionase family DNA binding protein
MKSTAGTATKRMFLDIPNAAELAGFSVRHFRRIIEDERIRIVQIGRKFFILGADFERWQSTKSAKQIDARQSS